ncbi:MAG: PEP-CTERM/exosortase system-associated acyltransferase [Gammaproteobacteria bacterium]|jgi:N-acyl amino acid synthase of PEP-CTERM/exosortase system|nr:PEP-CTERM/exosortase system-associated acyltransferase [Gammaproteobacteria bacterium]
MFDDHFEVFVADTPGGRAIHYRIRYEVYCRETGFEDSRDFPDGEERDRYDEHSIHFLVRHRPSQDWIAAMRLVLPRGGRLPFADLCPSIKTSPLPVATRDAAEVSRLCMVEGFRRRGLEHVLPYGLLGSDLDAGVRYQPDRRHSQEILLGLLRAAYSFNRNVGYRYWYFLVGHALARLLRRTGIILEAVAEPFEHRGLRTPYVADVELSHVSVTSVNPEIRAFFEPDRPGYRLFSQIELPERRRARETEDLGAPGTDAEVRLERL